ncbi:ComEC/Rec2 family competence protein, partial [Gordonia soli]
GANFALVCGSVLAVVRAVGTPPRTTAVIGALVILAFVVLVRPSPSVLRAAMMGAVGILALASSRRSQAIPALGTATIVGLLWWPGLAVSPGFALSVAATGGLVVLGAPIRDRLTRRRVPRGLAEVLAMAIAAQIVTAPIIAGLSGSYSAVSVVANVLVAPVVGVIAIAGTAAALVGAIGPPSGICADVALVVLRGLIPEVWWMLACARTAANTPWARLPVPDGAVGAVVVIAVTVVVVLVVRNRHTRRLRSRVRRVWQHERRERATASAAGR